MQINYRNIEGGVTYDGHAHLPQFFRAIAPDVETLRKNLQKYFPGETLELVLVE